MTVVQAVTILAAIWQQESSAATGPSGAEHGHAPGEEFAAGVQSRCPLPPSKSRCFRSISARKSIACRQKSTEDSAV
eukprot:symbB.v1.2.033444.t1/scaffold4157.1/size43777/3